MSIAARRGSVPYGRTRILSPAPLTRLPPESDLRSVPIRQLKAHASLADCVKSPLGSSEPREIFFSKGTASAEAFRPAYWTYDGADAENSGVVQMRAPDKSGIGPDLVRWESEFLATQHRLLSEPRSYADDDEALVEEKPVPTERSALPPEADLRTIVIRPRLQIASSKPASLEELFAKKTESAPAAAAAELSLCADAPAELVNDDVPPPSEPEAQLALAPKPPAPPPPGVGIRITVLACACAALAVIFAARSALMSPPATPVAAVAVATPAASVAAPSVVIPLDTEAQALVVQGNHYLALHDVISARLYFERAAEKGDGQAALLAGMTFDPLFLANAGVYGFKGDESQAQAWYRRARDLGDPEAAKFLPQAAAH